MTLLELITILVALGSLLMGLVVLGRKPLSKLHWAFFFLSFSISLWVLSGWQAGIVRENINLPLWWERITFSSAALIAISLLYFSLLFTEKRLSLLPRLIVLLIIPTFIVIISLTQYVVESAEEIALGYEPMYGSLWYLYAVYFIAYTLTALLILFRKHKNSFGILRLRIKYLLTGLLLAASIGVLANLIIPLFITLRIFENNSFFQLLFHFSHFVAVFFIGFTSYAILRYRLMDIKVIIRKGFINFISLIIILFLYLYILLSFQNYFIQEYSWSNQASIIVFVLVIALTIEPLRRFLFKLVDKAFYSKQKSAKEEAKKLRVVLSSSMQFDQLVKKVKTELQDFLEVPEIQFIWLNKQTGKLENYYKEDKKVSFSPTDPVFQYLRSNPGILITEEIPYLIEEQGNGEREILQSVEKKLKALGIGLVLPIGEKGELVGAFFFGQKRKKEAFTSDNVDYLSRMQFQMTNAIANALLYKQAVERIALNK